MPPGCHRVALDIETIATVDSPDFEDPAHWIPFAIATGYRSPDGEIDVDVLFRDDCTAAAEARLLDEGLDWIAERTPADSREILTYNGNSYDLPILQHRATELSNHEPQVRLPERLDLLLDSTPHTDLIEIMRERRGHWVSLDDALADHGIDAETVEWNGEKVTGADMLDMGLQLIRDDAPDGLRDVVHRYAASDVRPLFRLDDALRAQVVNTD
jgi:hypothetical protein